MKLSLIKIGNSQGVRLPKALLEQCNFKDSLYVHVKEGMLILSATKKPREGWAEAFKVMAQRGDDKLIELGDIDLSTDNDEWVW
ncbi:MAG: AbrB/MazE/SpoVT family DNA-binding domain-containing protein [Candidatus Babeliales bacterium]